MPIQTLTHHEDYVAFILPLKVLSAEDESCREERIFDAMFGLTSDSQSLQCA